MDGSGLDQESRFHPLTSQGLGGRGTPGARLGYFQRLATTLKHSTVCLFQVKKQENPDAPNVPQPDNAEQKLKLLERKEESCLALATNLWQSDTVWNDIACYHQKEWICEDSDKMLKEAGLA